MSLSYDTANDILDTLLEASLYAGVSTADPGRDGTTLAEPSGNSYARVAVDADDWDAAADGAKTTSSVITFPEASGAWGTITYFCIFDADEDGNLLAYGALTAGKTITSGQTLRFPAGDVDVTLS